MMADNPMAGFRWEHTESRVRTRGRPALPDGGDGYCLRDAVCELMGWVPGSPPWHSFPESPDGHDLGALDTHLGLTSYDISYPEDLARLATHVDHPGFAMFLLQRIQQTHAVFVYSIRELLGHWAIPDGNAVQGRMGWLWPLHPQYAAYAPMLLGVTFDDRQVVGNAIRPAPHRGS